MTEVTMMERLARAAFAGDRNTEGFDPETAVISHEYYEIARAILTELREPSEAMVKAAMAPAYHKSQWAELEVRREWRAMLDCVLGE